VNRTGIGWDYLPHDLPPRSTVYWYFSEWERDGTGEKIHDVLRKWVRKAAGRAVEPTAALVDAQSIRTSSNVPEASQGIDAGKYAGWAVMPGRAGWADVAAGQDGWVSCRARHIYRFSRKASSWSVGRNRAAAEPGGAVRARAASFTARSAWR
jgi:Putative transposase of IS4/5 family (DUF4096)